MAGLKEKLLSERKELLGSNCALNFSKNPLVILRGKSPRDSPTQKGI